MFKPLTNQQQRNCFHFKAKLSALSECFHYTFLQSKMEFEVFCLEKMIVQESVFVLTFFVVF